jgi:hypothetical protein
MDVQTQGWEEMKKVVVNEVSGDLRKFMKTLYGQTVDKWMPLEVAGVEARMKAWMKAGIHSESCKTL